MAATSILLIIHGQQASHRAQSGLQPDPRADMSQRPNLWEKSETKELSKALQYQQTECIKRKRRKRAEQRELIRSRDSWHLYLFKYTLILGALADWAQSAPWLTVARGAAWPLRKCSKASLSNSHCYIAVLYYMCALCSLLAGRICSQYPLTQSCVSHRVSWDYGGWTPWTIYRGPGDKLPWDKILFLNFKSIDLVHFEIKFKRLEHKRHKQKLKMEYKMLKIIKYNTELCLRCIMA